MQALLERARRDAGLAGGELGALRKEASNLRRELSQLRATPAPRTPVVTESPVYRELEGRLEAARREADRLRVEQEQAQREVRQATILLNNERQTTKRLMEKLNRSPAVEIAAGSFSITLPFSYEGGGGSCRLKGGYAFRIPEQVARKLDLIDGDTVCLTLTALGKIRCEVTARVPRAIRRALARRAANADSGEPEWYAAPIPGLAQDTGEGTPAASKPFGRIARDEAGRAGLTEGDPIEVLVPQVDRFPTVRVLRVLEVGPRPVAGVEPLTPGRSRRTARRPAITKGAAPDEECAGRLPLEGKTVVIVGGDSFRVNYRRAVHRLGGEVKFIPAGGGDMDQVRALAMSADVTVLMSQYIGHKVKDVVMQALSAAGRMPLYVNSTGSRALRRELLAWADGRGQGGGETDAAV